MQRRSKEEPNTYVQRTPRGTLSAQSPLILYAIIPRSQAVMKTSAGKALVAAAVVFAVSVTAAALIYKSRRPADSAPGTVTPAALTAPPAIKPSSAFRLHEQPRALESFKFVTGEWQAASLDDFRGKVVLLNMWATWCGPCRAEMPTLDKLQATLGGRDFEVVALSIDEGGVPVVKRFYEELGLKSLRIYVDPTLKAPVTLKAIGVPTTLLINREGKEIGRYAGPAEWDSPSMVGIIRQQLAVPLANQGG
jgi:thiol-disulfide isomerase/thioredoxin